MRAGLTTAAFYNGINECAAAEGGGRSGCQGPAVAGQSRPPMRWLFAPALGAVLRRRYAAELREHAVAQVARDRQRAGLQNVEQLLALAVRHAPVFFLRARYQRAPVILRKHV